MCTVTVREILSNFVNINDYDTYISIYYDRDGAFGIDEEDLAYAASGDKLSFAEIEKLGILDRECLFRACVDGHNDTPNFDIYLAPIFEDEKGSEE